MCKGNKCPVYHKNFFIYKDGSHLAATFVKDYASFVDGTIMS
jgi:hypothetical protein